MKEGRRPQDGIAVDRELRIEINGQLISYLRHARKEGCIDLSYSRAYTKRKLNISRSCLKDCRPIRFYRNSEYCRLFIHRICHVEVRRVST